jgi:hypothetical protein
VKAAARRRRPFPGTLLAADLQSEKVMNRRSFFTLLILPALAVCVGAVGPANRAAPRTKAKTAKAGMAGIKDAIKRNGKLPGGATYWRHAQALHRGKKQTIAAAPLTAKADPQDKRPGAARMATAVTRHSLTTVGGDGLPAGFGKGFSWDRADNEVLLVMFINAADPLGISIDGMQAGDQLQVLSASGIASFSKDKGNPLASSIVGLLAAGGKVVAGAEGVPEINPVIDAAEQFAKDQFKATGSKRELRDAFGAEPSSGKMARQEGGLLVCMPEAGGTFYSGDDGHKQRWVKGDGTRSDEHLPAHFNYSAFFPQQGLIDHNTRIAQQSGPLYVLAWDWAFEDNAGFYKVFVKLTKGNGLPPPVLERKGVAAKPKPKR